MGLTGWKPNTVRITAFHPEGMPAGNRGLSDSDTPGQEGFCIHPGGVAAACNVPVTGLLRPLQGRRVARQTGGVAGAQPPATGCEPSGFQRKCSPSTYPLNSPNRTVLGWKPVLLFGITPIPRLSEPHVARLRRSEADVFAMGTFGAVLVRPGDQAQLVGLGQARVRRDHADIKAVGAALRGWN